MATVQSKAGGPAGAGPALAREVTGQPTTWHLCAWRPAQRRHIGRSRRAAVPRMPGRRQREQAGVWRNGSASDSRSEGWEFESLCPQSLVAWSRPPRRTTTFTKGTPGLNQGSADLQSAALTTERCTRPHPNRSNGSMRQTARKHAAPELRARNAAPACQRRPLACNDTLTEWLRRLPAKPMGSPRAGSNHTGVAIAYVGGFALRPVQGVVVNRANDLLQM